LTRTSCWIIWRKSSIRRMGLRALVRLSPRGRDGKRCSYCLGFIIDHHDPSLFPERWIDLVVVLRCDNSVLHSRLSERYVFFRYLSSEPHLSPILDNNAFASLYCALSLSSTLLYLISHRALPRSLRLSRCARESSR
jgi:hypothetical protein